MAGEGYGHAAFLGSLSRAPGLAAALESDSRAALEAYTRWPAADTLLAWQDAHHLLQGLSLEAAREQHCRLGLYGISTVSSPPSGSTT